MSNRLSFEEHEVNGDKSWEKVTAYSFLWSKKRQKGIIKLNLASGSQQKIVVKTLADLKALVELLDRPNTLHYSTLLDGLASGWVQREYQNGTVQANGEI